MPIKDILNNYNSEHNVPRGSTIEEALQATLSSVNQTVIDAGDELPDVTPSDEGKILKVNQAGQWVIGDDESGVLPAVTASDEGKALVVDENGEWVAGEVAAAEPKVFNCTTSTSGSTQIKVLSFASGAEIPTRADIYDGALIRVRFNYDNTYTSGYVKLSLTTSDGYELSYSVSDTLGYSITDFVKKIHTSNSSYDNAYYTFKYHRFWNVYFTTYYQYWVLVDTEPHGYITYKKSPGTSSKASIIDGTIDVFPAISGTTNIGKVLGIADSNNNLGWRQGVPSISTSTSGKYLYNNGTSVRWESLGVNSVPTPTSTQQSQSYILTADTTYQGYGWAAPPAALPSISNHANEILAAVNTGSSYQASWIDYTKVLQGAVPTHLYNIKTEFNGFTEEFPYCPMVPHPGEDYVDNFGQSVLCAYAMQATSDSVRTNFIKLLMESQVLGGFYVDFYCDNGIGIPVYSGSSYSNQRVQLMPNIKFSSASNEMPQIATTGYAYDAYDFKTVMVSFKDEPSRDIKNYLITFGYEIGIPGNYSSSNKPSFAFTVFRMTDLSGNPITSTSFLSSLYINITFPAMSTKGNIDWTGSWESVQTMSPAQQ